VENRLVLYAWERLIRRQSEDCDKSHACLLCEEEDGIRGEQGAAGSLAFSYAGLGVYGNFFPNNRTGTFSCGPLFVCFDD